MSAELGDTVDPRALIPGEPESISANLRDATDTMRTVDTVGTNLTGIAPQQWSGPASDQFRTAFGAQPPQWSGAVERLGNAGQALGDYGNTLAWGQSEAQRAIEAHTQAQAASRLAAAQYNEQAQAAIMNGTQVGMLPPFEDPSRGATAQAQQILDNARRKVGEAAEQAVDWFTQFTDDKGKSTYKESPGQLDKKYGNQVQEVTDRNTKYTPFERPTNRKGGMGGKFLSDVVDVRGPEKTLADAEAKIALLQGRLGGKFGNGTAGGSGAVEGSVLGADAKAGVSAGPMGVTAAASAEAYLAKGSADGELHAGPAELQGHAESMVGAQANANAHLGPTGLQAKGEAFVGGKAGGDASASVGGVGAGVHGEVSYGLGASASAKLGMGNDGKFHIGASAGLTVGVGGKVGFDIEVDPKEISHTVHDVADDVGDAADTVVDAAGGGIRAAGDFLGL